MSGSSSICILASFLAVSLVEGPLEKGTMLEDVLLRGPTTALPYMLSESAT